MFDASNNGSVKPNNSPEMVEVVESSVGTLGTPRLQRAGFVPKIRRHFKKFWWLHSIIFCASFLVIALCLLVCPLRDFLPICPTNYSISVYVALPRIAQSGINSSSLSFYELQFLDPKPNSITLTQKATLHTTTIFTPTLDPFTASLWLATSGIFPSDPITSIELPAIHALHPDSNVTIINQVLNISNPQELADFTIQVLSQENVTTALTGSTRAHEGKLPVVTINYNSSITYKSLNGLRVFNATNLKLNLTAAAGDPNLIGNAYIPDPSVMTVEMVRFISSVYS
jgi:hypothetical protein